MEHPKCKVCGDRHRLGPCPKFSSSRGEARGEPEPAARAAAAKRPEKAEATTATASASPRETKPKKEKAVKKAKGKRAKKAKAKVAKAAKVNVSRGRPKKGEEANTLKAAAPWVTLGMSRATWFRRGKPQPGEAK